MTVYEELFLQTVSLALTSKHLESGLKTEKMTVYEGLFLQTVSLAFTFNILNHRKQKR